MTSESKRKLADILEHAEVTKTIEHDWSGFNYNGKKSADTIRDYSLK